MLKPLRLTDYQDVFQMDLLCVGRRWHSIFTGGLPVCATSQRDGNQSYEG
jgi:hypothetical protein